MASHDDEPMAGAARKARTDADVGLDSCGLGVSARLCGNAVRALGRDVYRPCPPKSSTKKVVRSEYRPLRSDLHRSKDTTTTTNRLFRAHPDGTSGTVIGQTVGRTDP